jgi:anti-sigma regulatory factor (Ser/Thr protein kinase)
VVDEGVYDSSSWVYDSGVSDDQRVRSLLGRRGRTTTSAVAERLGVSRQAAHRRLRRLADAGVLDQVGLGRAAAWVLAPPRRRRFRFRTAGLAEDRAWNHVRQQLPKLDELPDACRRILAYAFTELVNNVLDHSGSAWIEVELGLELAGVVLEVSDRGVGVFERVRRGLGLRTPLEAFQELHKGKITTDREHHTGEGIFFTSKAAERFELEANGLRWTIDATRGDFTVAEGKPVRGTRVTCHIPHRPRRTLAEVFAEYTVDLEFARTRTLVRLYAMGTEFVSRSEARRLLSGLERFREVVLDFERVSGVGQGFADEVFRVWARAHPETLLIPVSAAPTVQIFIDRALRHGD